jgi:sodium transport system permease protein
MSTSAKNKAPVSSGFGRLRRLTIKELRETLRDRRTIITLILMPVLVYPILSIVFRTVLLSGMDFGTPSDEPVRFLIVSDRPLSFEVERLLQLADKQLQDEELASRKVDGDDDASAVPTYAPILDHIEPIQTLTIDVSSVEKLVEKEDTVDLGLITRRNTDPQSTAAIEFELIFKGNNQRARAAAAFLSERLELANLLYLQGKLRNAGQNPNQLATTKIRELAGEDKSGMSLASLIPLILILMTITGAVYPAIDLTAGERERGTLEALVAAPIPRRLILVSKFIAVLTVAVLTATLNLIGMLSTVWAFGLDNVFLADTRLTVSMVAQIFVLMILFAAFFSAVLLAITSFAKSFKEAQAYLIPVILLSLGPGIAGLMPSISLEGPAAVVPMLNIVLLSRDVMQADVSATAATIAVISTLIYGAVAIVIAARLFGTDAVLYGSQGSWQDMLRRPKKATDTATPEAALFCLVILFPVNFIVITVLSRGGAAWSFQTLLLASSVSTIVCFGFVPLLVALNRRVRISTGFGINGFSPFALLAAVILGLSLWPMVMGLVELTHQFYSLVSGAEAAKDWAERLVEVTKDHSEKIKTVSPLLIILMLGVIPAFFEECFFRGLLLRSLLKHQSPWLAILVTSLAFGAFHILASSVISLDRFMPTMLMGLVLGFVCWRTGSIIPSIVLHCVHNTTVSLLGVYHDKIDKISWLPFTSQHVPWWIYVGSALISAITLSAVYYFGSHAAREAEPEVAAES